MTLIELASLLLVLGLAGVCGGISWVAAGPLAAALGWLGGAAFFPLLAALVCQIEPFFTGRPHWPACGRCGGNDHRLEPWLGRTVVRCACGERYLRRGRQFLHVTAAGASRPYLRWRILRGWIDEQTPDAPATWTPYRNDDTQLNPPSASPRTRSTGETATGQPGSSTNG